MLGGAAAVRCNFSVFCGYLPIRIITVAGGQGGIIDGVGFLSDLFDDTPG